MQVEQTSCSVLTATSMPSACETQCMGLLAARATAGVDFVSLVAPFAAMQGTRSNIFKEDSNPRSECRNKFRGGEGMRPSVVRGKRGRKPRHLRIPEALGPVPRQVPLIPVQVQVTHHLRAEFLSPVVILRRCQLSA